MNNAKNPTTHHREIRSFVRRMGRLTDAQAHALTTHWHAYGLDFLGHPRDLHTVFNQNAPLIIEIGFGNGEQLLHAALHNPDCNFLGIEVHRPGVGRLLHHLAQHQISNVRIYCHDAVEVLSHDIAPESVQEMRIYFPDPWPKKRHNKRRLIQTPFVTLLQSRLVTHGLLHLATDWQPYAEHMLDVLNAFSQLRNTSTNNDFVMRPDWRIETHFEKRGKRLGHGVWDLLYLRL